MFHRRFEGKLVLKLVIGLVAGTMLAGTIGSASAEEAASTDPKDQQIQQLRTRVSALTTENARLTARNRRVVADNSKLRRAIRGLRARVRRLRARAWYLWWKLRTYVRRVANMFGPWRSSRASWYGPGFYGGGLAGGGVLRPGMKIFAHRTMRFGTKVQFKYGGRTVVAVAKDRGPFIAGRDFDLGPGTAKALGFDGVGTVRWRVLR